MGYVIKEFYHDWDHFFQRRKESRKNTEENHNNQRLKRDKGRLLDLEERAFFQEEAKKYEVWH